MILHKRCYLRFNILLELTERTQATAMTINTFHAYKCVEWTGIALSLCTNLLNFPSFSTCTLL